MMGHMTIEDLQRFGRSGDEQSLAELGKRVLDFNFCLFGNDGQYCDHRDELHKLEIELATEPPTDCPHCGKLIEAAGDDHSNQSK